MTDYSKDYYAVLGVPSSATASDIRYAYIGLALAWHPDRHSGESPERVAYAEARFKEIGEAYALLSDYDARKQYDYFHSLSSSAAARPSPSSRRPAARPSRPSAGTSSASGPHSGSAGSGSSSGASRSSGSSTRRDSSFDRGRTWGADSRTYTYQDTSRKSIWSRREGAFRKFLYGMLIPASIIFSSLSGLFFLVEKAGDTIRYHSVQYQPSVIFWKTEDTVKMETFYERMIEMMDFPKVEAREINLRPLEKYSSDEE